MNFFKLYPGDYQRDTAHLSLAEHGAYMLMLQHYCATEKPLPSGKALHRMLRAQDKDEKDAIDSVVRQFWHESSDGLTNNRGGIEIDKAHAQAETNRATAIAREAARKGSREEHESCSDRDTNVTTKPPPRAGDHNHSHSVSEIPQGRSPSGSRLPTDWGLPDDWRRWAQSERPDLDLVLLAADFADFWHSKPGKDGRKLDWQATWRRWVRGQKVASRPNGSHASATEGLQ